MGLWIGFFRGINVGGHHILPMKKLKSALEGIGCTGVSTYIQSGNVVCSHKESRAGILQSSIARTVRLEFGFEPRILLLTVEQLNSAVASNPFPVGEREPKSLHLYFLSENARQIDWDALNALKSDREQFQLLDRVFYLHAPDGIGRSKLAAKVEKLLGVAVTARNWRTVQKVLQLAQ